MKLGIIGDVHLGASLSLGTKDVSTGIHSRLKDYYDTLIETLKLLSKEGCSVLVFTGDIFEHRQPAPKQQELFSKALTIAQEELGFQEIHIVVGNHDQQRSQTSSTIAYLKELPLPKIHVHDEISLVRLGSGKEVTNLLFLPYRDRNYLKAATNEDAIQQIATRVKTLKGKKRNICIGHMPVEGTLALMEKYADLYNGNELFLPKELFKGIDLTVMGHIHTPGSVSTDPRIVYVGSMEKRGAFETETKTALAVDLADFSLKEFGEPCRPIHELNLDCPNPQGAELMPHLEKLLDRAAILPHSLVKVSITLAEADRPSFDQQRLIAALRTKHQVSNVSQVKTIVRSIRTGRDLKFTEDISEQDAFDKFVETQLSNNTTPAFRARVAALGRQIMEDCK